MFYFIIIFPFFILISIILISVGETDWIDLKFGRLIKPCYEAFNKKTRQPRKHYPYDDNDMLIFPVTHPPSQLLKTPTL
jgi:hypothetical protein